MHNFYCILYYFLIILISFHVEGYKIKAFRRLNNGLRVMPSSSKFYGGDSRPKATDVPINEQIKSSPVRVIIPGNTTTDGEPTEVMAGIFSISEALKMAETYEMDLVLINEKGDPPVCKVIDYGKFKYSQERKKKENIKKQIKVEIKEVKMSYKIDQHDFDVRLRAVQKFIGDGDKVCFISLLYIIINNNL